MGPEPKPEIRVHVHLYYSTIGQPLDNRRAPYELIECILHAMIGTYAFRRPWFIRDLISKRPGRYNVLTKSKALHRDVSEGDILIVEEDVTDVGVFNEL